MQSAWIGMAGLKGCMPQYCELFESQEDAEDTLAQIHEFDDSGINHSRRLRQELRRDGYVDLDIHKHGNEYAAVKEHTLGELADLGWSDELDELAA